jgi:hypothetical protein
MISSKLALTSLSSTGCHLPGMQVPMARLIREAVISALWPTAASDAVATSAMLLACNLHPEARWWIVHQYEAQDLIAEAMACLLALRHRTAEPLKDAL